MQNGELLITDGARNQGLGFCYLAEAGHTHIPHEAVYVR